MSEQRPSVNDEKSEKAWFHEEVLTSPGNGAWILKPNGTNGMGVTLSISSGVGKVQATTDSIDNIINGSAEGVDWDLGTVSGTEQDSAVQLTAVRQVNISGTTKIKVVAQ
jgi:hypothetical protein